MNHIIKLIITKNKIKIFHHIPWKELKDYHGIQKIWIWFITHFSATLKGHPILLLEELKNNLNLNGLKAIITSIDQSFHNDSNIKITLTFTTKTSDMMNTQKIYSLFQE